MVDETPDELYIAAAKSGDLTALRTALCNGADLYAYGDGLNAMSHAIQQDQEHIVDELLERGFNPDFGHETGASTPLQVACGWGRTSIAEKLILAKADLNAANSFGDDAMSWALEFNYRACLDLLLDAGADPKRAQSQSSLLLREHPENADIVKYFNDIVASGVKPGALSGKLQKAENARAGDALAQHLRDGLAAPIATVKPLRLTGIRHMLGQIWQ